MRAVGRSLYARADYERQYKRATRDTTGLTLTPFFRRLIQLAVPSAFKTYHLPQFRQLATSLAKAEAHSNARADFRSAYSIVATRRGATVRGGERKRSVSACHVAGELELCAYRDRTRAVAVNEASVSLHRPQSYSIRTLADGNCVRPAERDL